MEAVRRPLVCTSGNLSDEPICTDNRQALQHLRNVADLFLVHDRPVVRPVDDSVARLHDGSLQPPAKSPRLRTPTPRPRRRSAPDPRPRRTSQEQPSPWDWAPRPSSASTWATSTTPSAARHTCAPCTNCSPSFAWNPRPSPATCTPDYASTRLAEDLAARWRLPLYRIPAPPRTRRSSHGRARRGRRNPRTGLGRHRLRHRRHRVGRRNPAVQRHILCPRSLAPTLPTPRRRPRRARTPTLRPGPAPRRMGRRRPAPRRRDVRTPRNARAAGSPRPQRECPPHQQRGPTLRRRRSPAGPGEPAPATRARPPWHANSPCSACQTIPATQAPTPCPCAQRKPANPASSTGNPLSPALLDDRARGVSAGIMAARFHNALVEGAIRVVAEAGLPPGARVALGGGCFQNAWLIDQITTRLQADGFHVLTNRRVPTQRRLHLSRTTPAGRNHPRLADGRIGPKQHVSTDTKEAPMCLAIPGKLHSINDDGPMRTGKVDFGGILKEVCLAYTPRSRDRTVRDRPRRLRHQHHRRGTGPARSSTPWHRWATWTNCRPQHRRPRREVRRRIPRRRRGASPRTGRAPGGDPPMEDHGDLRWTNPLHRAVRPRPAPAGRDHPRPRTRLPRVRHPHRVHRPSTRSGLRPPSHLLLLRRHAARARLPRRPLLRQGPQEPTSAWCTPHSTH